MWYYSQSGHSHVWLELLIILIKYLLYEISENSEKRNFTVLQVFWLFILYNQQPRRIKFKVKFTTMSNRQMQCNPHRLKAVNVSWINDWKNESTVKCTVDYFSIDQLVVSALHLVQTPSQFQMFHAFICRRREFWQNRSARGKCSAALLSEMNSWTLLCQMEVWLLPK